MCDKRNDNKKCQGSIKTALSQSAFKIIVRNLVVFINALGMSYAIFSGAFANPVDGQIVAGNVTIQQAPHSTVINQTSDKAIINWQSFNIGPNEATHFHQPSSNSMTLNRINSNQGASQIFGQLTANGKIILVNQAGIFFRSGAHVDVGGIIASTSDITNANFLAGKYNFNNPSTLGGSIINEGTIIARDNGLVALLGTGVINNGMIMARLGNIILASGNNFTLDFYGDGLVSFTVDEEATRSGINRQGKSLKNGVSNTGKLIADGGNIFITARSAQGILDKIINMAGVAQAHSVSQKNGTIILAAESAGKVRVSGRLDVSSNTNQGGTIKILGNDIRIESPSVLNASGTTGGGEILIGGNAHGSGSELNADYTRIATGVTIEANAILKGDGGRIVIWSDLGTEFFGNISAKGGSQSGNGGWIETSSQNYLNVNGSTVNTLAPFGNTGTWLLDPTNIYIALNQANATTAGMTGTDTSANSVSGGISQASGAVLSSLLTTGVLDAALGTTNVIVTTTNASGTGVGNITVVDPIAWATTSTLTLTAANNIAINAGISDTAAGKLILNAAGSVTQNASGIISGSLAVTQQGSGTTTFNQINTYTGITTISGGILSATTLANQNSNSSIGTNTFLLNGGTLSYTGGSTGNLNRNFAVGASGGTLQVTTSGATLTLAGTINPAGAGGGNNPVTFDVNAGNITLNPGTTTTAFSDVTVTGSGTGILLFNKTGMLTGNLTVNSGTFNAGPNGVLPATSLLTVNGGTFDLTNSVQSIGGLAGSGGIVTNSSGGGGQVLTIASSVNGYSQTYAGNITGNLGLLINLTGTSSPTQTLTSANSSYTKATTITSGTLSVAHIAASGFSSSLGTGSVTPVISIAGAGILQYIGVGGESTNRGIILTATGGTLDVSGTTSFASAATFSGGVTGNNFGLVLTGSGYGIESGIIATTGGTFTKNGTGTWSLTGLNTYTGTSTINAGTVSINTLKSIGGGSSSLGAPTTAPNGTITLGSGTNAATLSVTGAGNTSARLFTLGGSGGATIQTASGSTGTLTLSGNITNGTTPLTFDVSGSAISESGIIGNGAGTLTKAGSGTLTLSGTNTYTGATTINNGTLVASVVGALGPVAGGAINITPLATQTAILDLTAIGSLTNTTGAIKFDSSAATSTAQLNTTVAITLSNPINLLNASTNNIFSVSANTTALNGAITGTGGLTKSGAGILAFGAGSSSNTYSGVTTINVGTLQQSVVNSLPLNSQVNLANIASAVLNLNGLAGTIGSLTGGGGAGGNITLTSAALTIGNDNTSPAAYAGLISSTTIGGSIIKIGTGILTLSNIANTYTGTTTINNGALSVTALANAGSNSSLGAPAAAQATITLGSVTASTLIDTNIGGSDSTNRSITIGGVSGGIISATNGTLTLTGAVTTASNQSVTFNTNGGNITESSAGLITGAGNLTKTGLGTLTLSAANNYSGATSVSAGTLSLGIITALGNTTSTTVANNAALNLAFTNGTLTGNTINLNGTGVSGAGALTMTGNSDTVNNLITLQTSSTIGGTGTGTLILGGTISGTNTNLTVNLPNAGVSLPTTTLTTSGNLSVTTSGAITQTGILTIPGTSSFTAGANPITLMLSNALTGAVTLSNSGTNNATINNSINLTLAASTVGNKLTATSSGAIILNGSLTGNAIGDSIILSGASFNNSGGFSLNPGSSGRFLVWSSNPNPFGGGTPDIRGGLVYNFKQYNATYGVTTVLGSGNGFLYTLAPSITPSLTGVVSKSYTGTTAATLAPSNYTFSGAVDSDTVTLNNPISGTYGSVNVGTNLNVSVSGIGINSATNGSAMVYGYQLSSTTANASIGTITPAALTITANNLSKTYGQTMTFAGTEFTNTPLQNGETVGSTTLTSAGAVNTANVSPGSPYSIVASAATGGTFSASNYSISYVNGALTVNPATLTYNANTASRTYGAVNPALSGTVTGFVLGQTQAGTTTGTASFTTPAIATSNVGSYAINGSGLTANNGNYTFIQAAPNATALTINPATLTYNANTASMIASNPVPPLSGAVTGFVNSESQATATTGTLAFLTAAISSSDPGSYAINGSGLTANAGNYVFVQALGNATALTIQPNTAPLPPVVPVLPSVIVVPILPFGLIDKGLIVNVLSQINQGTNNSVNITNSSNLITIHSNLTGNNLRNIAVEGVKLNNIPRVSSYLSNNLVNAQNGVSGMPIARFNIVTGQTMLPSLVTNYYGPMRLLETINEFFSSFEAYIPMTDDMFKLLLASLAISMVLLTWLLGKQKVKLAMIKKNKLRGEMSTVSFKLRSALDSISGFAGLMYAHHAGQVSVKQMEYLGDIMTESNNILSNLVKIESGNNPRNKKLAMLQFTLRTSLNSILGFANMLYHGEVGKISPIQRGLIGDILSGSNDALQTITAG